MRQFGVVLASTGERLTCASVNSLECTSHTQIIMPVRPLPPLQWTAITLRSSASIHLVTSFANFMISLTRTENKSILLKGVMSISYQTHTYTHIYVYIYIHVCIYIYMYVYICRAFQSSDLHVLFQINTVNNLTYLATITTCLQFLQKVSFGLWAGTRL